jgi:hypothetical protein
MWLDAPVEMDNIKTTMGIVSQLKHVHVTINTQVQSSNLEQPLTGAAQNGKFMFQDEDVDIVVNVYIQIAKLSILVYRCFCLFLVCFLFVFFSSRANGHKVPITGMFMIQFKTLCTIFPSCFLASRYPFSTG